MNVNEIYLRRRNKIIVNKNVEAMIIPFNSSETIRGLATLLKNLEDLGYTFSESLIQHCMGLRLANLKSLYFELVPFLKKMKGANVVHKPMYPNFPQQVMEMSEAELYLNAIVHYWSGGNLFPHYAHLPRPKLREKTEVVVIDLGTEEDFAQLFTQLVGSNTSLSEQDKEDIKWFVEVYNINLDTYLPDSLPYKENIAYLLGLLLNKSRSADYVNKLCKTPTDVLRVATAMSGGDVSLAANTKFKTFSRPQRRLLLSVLDKKNPKYALEEILSHGEKWKRLLHKLHPGDYKSQYPNAYLALSTLARGEKVSTFRGRVEDYIKCPGVPVTHLLQSRPGEYARRIDQVLRNCYKNTPSFQANVVQDFEEVIDQVSTPVLLQVREHFINRNNLDDRVFFPKGNVAKVIVTENNLPKLPETICNRVAATCTKALIKRFSTLEDLGNVFVDPKLDGYLIPFSQRSASKSLKTLVRGSKIPITDNKDTIRFFIYWKNSIGSYHTDVDLSAYLMDENFNQTQTVAYYNLKTFGGHHSGDITNAPNGASEFIDISLSKVLAAKSRYIAMSINMYSGVPFDQMGECFAGWMSRDQPNSGEIYDPRTVENRIDVTSPSKIVVPLIIDALERKVIWCDMASKTNRRHVNNVHGNKTSLQAITKAFVNMKKPKLYDLLLMHGQARGTLVADPNQADTIFDVASGIPFQTEKIASEFLI